MKRWREWVWMWCVLFGIIQFACVPGIGAEYAKRCTQTRVGVAHLQRANAQCVAVRALDDSVPGAHEMKAVCTSLGLTEPIQEHVEWLCTQL